MLRAFGPLAASPNGCSGNDAFAEITSGLSPAQDLSSGGSFTGPGITDSNLNDGQASFDASGLSIGTHTILYYYDSPIGCTAIESTFDVTSGPIINNVSSTSVSCGGSTDGSITVDATGPCFEYSIDGGANFQSSNFFPGLAVGDYLVAIRECGVGNCISNYSGNPVVITAQADVPQGTGQFSSSIGLSSLTENQCGGIESTNGNGPAWTTGNTVIDDDVYNVATVNRTIPSQFLDIAFSGIAIPPGAIINGIEVSILRKEGDTNGLAIVDSTIQLLDNGSPVGDNLADKLNNWPTVETEAVYGNSTSLWNYTWDHTNINDIGVRIQVIANGGGNPNNTEEALIDQVCLTVYFQSQAQVCDTEIHSFSISGINDSDGYNWSIPSGSTIISGSGTSSVVVDFGNSGTTGNQMVCATPFNSCGNGTGILF